MAAVEFTPSSDLIRALKAIAMVDGQASGNLGEEDSNTRHCPVHSMAQHDTPGPLSSCLSAHTHALILHQQDASGCDGQRGCRVTWAMRGETRMSDYRPRLNDSLLD